MQPLIECRPCVSEDSVETSGLAASVVVDLAHSNMRPLTECRQSDRVPMHTIPSQAHSIYNRTMPDFRRLRRRDPREVLRGFGPAPFEHPNIKIHCKPYLRSGSCMKHCAYVIKQVTEQGPCVFKIGMTSEPIARLDNYCGRWEVMHLLHACSTWRGAGCWKTT